MMGDRATREFLTLQEAAELLDFPVRWVRVLQGEGTLSTVVVDGDELLLRSDVMTYKAERDAYRREGLRSFMARSQGRSTSADVHDRGGREK